MIIEEQGQHSFKWTPLTCDGPIPVWTGMEFVIGSKRTPVLCYHEASSGWSNELTEMHEDIIGADHYIDRSSRQNAMNFLSPILKKPAPVILEIGCSSGFLLKELRHKAKHVRLIGSDFIGALLFKLSRNLKGVPLVQFDITKCPLDDSSVDGVVMLNVLEHIENDLAALKQLYRILKPKGLAVIEVPAGPHLYDFYDKHLLHHRRYKLNDLKSLVRKAGFTIERASHLGFFIYPVFAIVKKLNRRKWQQIPESERKSLVSRQIKQANANPVMHAIMKMELALGKYLNYPIGIRCLVTLRK